MTSFLRNLFNTSPSDKKRKKKRKGKSAPSLPAGKRVYAIGDIHGRLDLLDELLEKIDADVAARKNADTQLIFLGDLVDRGPDSAGVIERAMELARESDKVRFLMGNHEEMFLHALTGDVKKVRFFSRVGGQETILSYGLPFNKYCGMEMEELAERLPALVPQDHADFISAFEDLIVIGDYAFVHAGVRAGVPIEEQVSKDVRWIRGDFLRKDHKHDKMIVHGHTISEDVDERRGRIGIDTGAYESGILTAIGLEGTDRWFLQTGAD